MSQNVHNEYYSRYFAKENFISRLRGDFFGIFAIYKEWKCGNDFFRFLFYLFDFCFYHISLLRLIYRFLERTFRPLWFQFQPPYIVSTPLSNHIQIETMHKTLIEF